MAAADALRCIRNAPYRFHYQMRTITTGQLLAGDAANLDAEVSLASGAFADLAGAETEIGATATYFNDMTAAEMTADGAIVVRVQSATANTDEFVRELFPEPALDSGVAQSGAASSITLRAAASATNDLYNGAVIEIVRGTGAGQERSVTDYVGATKIATVDRAWMTNPDSTSVYIIHPRQGGTLGTDIVQKVNATQINSDANAAALLALLWTGGVSNASVNDAGPTTTGFVTSFTTSTTDAYKGGVLIFTSGALKGWPGRKITAYNGTTKAVTVSPAYPAAPANGDLFVVVGRID